MGTRAQEMLAGLISARVSPRVVVLVQADAPSCSRNPSVTRMWPMGWPNREGPWQPHLQKHLLHICLTSEENVLPVSAETALEALKPPVSHPGPCMMVLTNYGINMPGKGRQLSQRIGNAIKQGMIFSLKWEIYSFEQTVLQKPAVQRCWEGGQGHRRQKLKG